MVAGGGGVGAVVVVAHECNGVEVTGCGTHVSRVKEEGFAVGGGGEDQMFVRSGLVAVEGFAEIVQEQCVVLSIFRA